LFAFVGQQPRAFARRGCFRVPIATAFMRWVRWRLSDQRQCGRYDRCHRGDRGKDAQAGNCGSVSFCVKSDTSILRDTLFRLVCIQHSAVSGIKSYSRGMICKKVADLLDEDYVAKQRVRTMSASSESNHGSRMSKLIMFFYDVKIPFHPHRGQHPKD